MTDNVIKSLQWLIFNFPKVENPKDESDKICNCINLYCTNAVDLLKRQNAEIERLQKENERVKSDWASQKYLIEKMQQGHSAYVEQAKSEAIKEFAERVKMAFYYEFEELIPSIMADKIDNLVKEMTEGCGQ